MVFSSVPLYLDPPNWQQHEIHPNPHQQLQPAPSQGIGSSSRASSSMAERARMAKIPVPEGPLNCPRCDSTNTKFCYFNNYSLNQPRHFCKACRRYWTRGGALRSVPVGGGCRRNKRRKRTKSPKPLPPPQSAAEQHHPALDQHQQVVPTTAAAGSPYSFMASLQNMTSSLGMGNLGLGFGAPPPPNHHHHLLGGFGAGLTEPSNPSMMYPFQINGGGMETSSFGKAVGVKMEEMRPRAGQLRGGGAVMENVGHFWSTNFNGGLWN